MLQTLHRLHLLNFLRHLYIKTFSPSVHNPQFAKFLIDNFDGNWGQNTNRRTGLLGFGLVHLALITACRPSRILCIGSQRGFVPAICALGCKANSFGHVDFVDAGYSAPHPKAWSGDGFWRRTDPQRHFNQVNIRGWITTHIMTTAEFVESHPEAEFDYIYIDGDHSYRGVMSDYLLLWPKLNFGGYMSFHDVMATGKFNREYLFGTARFWKQVSRNQPHITLDGVSGLGILRKIK